MKPESRRLAVFDVQRFCFQDGPGIRTTIFTKGCSLRCVWCHNPESLRPDPELLYYADKCLHCGLCAGACPSAAHAMTPAGHALARKKCTACGACVETCPGRALELAGTRRDTDSLLADIPRDRAVYAQTGGGVTVSGGEPLLQPEPLAELLAACKERGIHTAVETAGNIPPDHLAAVLPHVDLFLWDFKALSPDLHRRGTGADNALILANLESLFAHFPGPIWIRIPVIPGFNDSEDELRNIARRLSGHRIERIELLPYHDIALSKYHALGLEYPMAATPPPKETLQALRNAVSGHWETR